MAANYSAELRVGWVRFSGRTIGKPSATSDVDDCAALLAWLWARPAKKP